MEFKSDLLMEIMGALLISPDFLTGKSVLLHCKAAYLCCTNKKYSLKL